VGLLATVLLVSQLMLRGPSLVDRLTFVNASDYDIHVEVSGGHGWLPLGVAASHCSTTFQEVVDQGEQWTIRFRAQGVSGGQVTVSRDDLAGSSWSFHVPDAVATMVEEAGAPPPPTFAVICRTE
jgi:hypothetical protein